MYIIKKTENKICCLDDKAWESANVADIAIINWPNFDYAPKTTAKILYNDYGLFVQLETNEKPLLATHSDQNNEICEDSCMELFFRPNENDPRYLNFEFNPFGTMYAAVRTSRYDGTFIERDKRYFNVQSYVDDKSWVLQFCIPFELINEIFGSYTKTMYGNMFKCGNLTATRHYLTFYPVGTPKPDFHRPEFFGQFVLE